MTLISFLLRKIISNENKVTLGAAFHFLTLRGDLKVYALKTWHCLKILNTSRVYSTVYISMIKIPEWC